MEIEDLKRIVKNYTGIDLANEDVKQMESEIRTILDSPSISVVDGRYASVLDEFRLIASDQNYYMVRMRVELAWLITVVRYINTHQDTGFEAFCSPDYESDVALIEKVYNDINFVNKTLYEYRKTSNEHYKKIREIEQTTQHDVKAIEYYIREFVDKKYHNLIHICITSQDINSVAMTCILQDICKYFVTRADSFFEKCDRLIRFNTDFLERTHGQIAVKGDMGHFIKKLALPLAKTIEKIKNQAEQLTAKFSSSTGNYSTLLIGFKDLKTIHYLQRMLSLATLGHPIIFNDYARQIDDYTSYVELNQIFALFSLQMRSFMEQIWLMITRGHIVQKKVEGEVGSSVMPQKVNPWRIEQGFGLFQSVYSGFNSVAQTLMASRDSRDMSDSVTLRFMIEHIGNTMLMMNTFGILLDRIEPNTEFCRKEIAENPQWKGEIVQTHLRMCNYSGDPYAQTAEFLKGKTVTNEDFANYVDSFECLTDDVKRTILSQ